MCSFGPEYPPGGKAIFFADPLNPGIQRPTVFVVDHDEAVRDSLSISLNANGFGVATFGTGSDFLKTSPLNRKGCLLVELDLADMAGTELIVRLIRRRIQMPAIIMSRRLRQPSITDPALSGIVGVLQKPFGEDAFLAMLRLALDHLD